jgi:hypothetical protein
MLISKTASVTIVGRNKEFYKKLGYVHKKFHHIYGFKHFTANDYYEFALLVKKGELDV